MIPYPDLDPEILRIGPVALRWYGVAYALGLASGWWVLTRRRIAHGIPLSREDLGALFPWLVAGVVVGGRLGYALFYNPAHYASHPLEVAAVWKGGMSFHGGLLGVAAGAVLWARRRSLSPLRLGDALALAAPPGLCFGRLANFINGELYGRATDLPWSMVFPGAGPLPRHPSQLYEALLEGPLLWALVWAAGRSQRARPGAGTTAFLLGYGVLRFAVEFTREPDRHLGTVLGPLTLGQALSTATVLCGVATWVAGRSHTGSSG